MAEENCQKLSKKENKKHKNEENEKGSSRVASSVVDLDGDYVDYIESTVKKKRKRRKKEGGGGGGEGEAEEEVIVEKGKLQVELQDPLDVLGFDIMHMIFSFLDARSVALSLLVSRGWHGVACSDRLWAPKCKELWHGKAHIPRISKLRGLSELAAYSLSAIDGKRTRITRGDLCDHVWEFHFTEEELDLQDHHLLRHNESVMENNYLGRRCPKDAPGYWRELDPYWKGTGQTMRRYFHQDGSQTADPGDEVWGGHEASCSVVTGLEANGKIREHYVRINRWPRMSVSRKQDWSWEMCNKLYCYFSIPDPDKDDGTGPFFPVV